MKLTRIFKSRRGAAMETAIVFLLSIFSLCALVTVLALTGNAQMRLENTLLTTKVEVEQIGEEYLVALGNGDQLSSYTVEVNERIYYCNKKENIFTIENEKGTVVLYVEATKDGGVTKWCYTDPDATE